MITGTGAIARMRRHTSVPAMPGQQHVEEDEVGRVGGEAAAGPSRPSAASSTS